MAATLTDKGLFYTEQLGAGLRVAQVLGLTSAAFLCGKEFSRSFHTVPALLQSPAPLLVQFQTLFDNGRFITPLCAAISTGVFGYFGYREPNPHSLPSILYLAASALTFSAVPYSYFLLEPLNDKLQKKAQDLASTSLTDTAAEAGVSEEETAHVLLDRWATVNLGRSIMVGVAAVAATWAAVDRLEIVPGVVRFATGAERMGR